MRSFTFNFLRVILLLVCLTFLFPSRASADWTKYPSNPILSPGNAWDTIDTRNPSIIYDGTTYKMWYDGFDGNHWKIGYATSSDGIHWIKHIDPVVDQSVNNLDSAEPNVLYDNGKYKMWFTSLTNDNTFSSIDYTESNDGINWNTPVIVLSKTQSWESQFLAHPHVIKMNNTYNLYYNGESNNVWGLGIATSSDGINWVKSTNNPIFHGDNNEMGLGSIIYDNSRYQIFYHSNHPPTAFYSATSTDGYIWTKNNTPLITNTINSFDGIEIISPFVLKDGNTYKMWYTGYNGDHWSIGYATEPVSATSSIHLLKQTDPQWGNQEYDSAAQWITKNEQPTISWWGCAITSLAMVLQHYGYNVLPDGTPLDPGSLNAWLLSQPDGYIDGGLVNWLAIPRLTMQAKSKNNITNLDALQFQWTNADKTLLTQDLNNDQPDILEEPGHFVVGTQVDGNTFDINDPYYTRLTLQDGYSNNFLSIRRYIPSHTDLSYILLTVDPSITVSITDSQGKTPSQEQQFIENPIINPISSTSGTLKSVKEILIQQPQNDNYTITISSPKSKSYNLSLYLYDKNGEVKTLSNSGFVGANNSDTFVIKMDTDNLQNTNVNKQVTFQSILNELKQFNHDKYMNAASYNSLTSLINDSNKNYQHKKLLPARLEIDTAILLIQTVFRNMINSSQKTILLQDLSTLKASF